MTGELYGITSKADIVHVFRKKRTICPGKGSAHGWLFMPCIDWNPSHPMTCKKCQKILEFERKAAEYPLSVKPAISPLSNP